MFKKKKKKKKKKNITDSSLSSCDAVENALHHLLSCPLHNTRRISLLNDVSQYQPFSLNLLIYGNASLLYATNVIIFQKVLKYTLDTKRFT